MFDLENRTILGSILLFLSRNTKNLAFEEFVAFLKINHSEKKSTSRLPSFFLSFLPFFLPFANSQLLETRIYSKYVIERKGVRETFRYIRGRRVNRCVRAYRFRSRSHSPFLFPKRGSLVRRKLGASQKHIALSILSNYPTLAAATKSLSLSLSQELESEREHEQSLKPGN